MSDLLLYKIKRTANVIIYTPKKFIIQREKDNHRLIEEIKKKPKIKYRNASIKVILYINKNVIEYC